MYCVDINYLMIPKVKFALDEFKSQPHSDEYSFDFSINEELGKESYIIKVDSNGKVKINGGDSSALMYAVLDLAERLSFNENLKSLNEIHEKPYIGYRGIKLNIPLDGRLPSFDDTGDASQNNISVMWEWDYWKNLLDDMAKNRYNLLTLWSTNPFPAMVRVPEYPDIYLDDICQYTGKITPATNFFWKDEDIQNSKNLKILKRMSIDEKIAFWTKVFNYATDRGVDIHLYNWNIFVYGAEGKYGITWDQQNPKTVDYVRNSVKAFLKTYPMVKGIGVTAGEYVDKTIKGRYSSENWLWETYGQGIMDAKYENPKLDVRFIFRQHWSDWSYVNDAFRNFDGILDASFKYSRARMFSGTTPPWFNHIFRESVEHYEIKSWFNLRNDDLFNFRWGNPEYANEYILNMPKELSPGYFVGSDGYIWGRVFNSKDKRLDGTFEYKKHWYNFMIWGRAGYNPYLKSDFYKKKLKITFPFTDENILYDTWKLTSDIVEWVDKIFFRQNDHMFSMEECMGNIQYVDNFININEMIKIGSMPEQNVISIANYAKGITTEGKITPFDVADKLDNSSKGLLAGFDKLKCNSDDAQFMETLVDFKAMAYLGRYYADKIRAATYVALYRVKGNAGYKENAIKYAKLSRKEWKNYSDVSKSAYYPQLLSRVSYFDWDFTYEKTKEDLEIARKAQYGDPVPMPHDNKLWKLEKDKI